MKYLSEDKKEFENEIACAAHELIAFPNKLQDLISQMALLPNKSQKFWCTPGVSGCACMGCANFNVKEVGLKKDHWEVWLNDYRQEMNYSVKLKSESNLKVKDFLLKINKRKTSFYNVYIPFKERENMTEFFNWGKSVVNEKKPIFISEEQFKAKNVLNKLKELFGDEFEIISSPVDSLSTKKKPTKYI